MAAVVDDCGSNWFHEYAGKLDAKHEGDGFEPGAGAQGPVLKTRRPHRQALTAPDGLGWQSASAGTADECRKARAPDDVDNAGAGRCLWLQQ